MPRQDESADASAPTVAVQPATAPTVAAAGGGPVAARGEGMDPRYELGELLGRGGMGEVRLAHDERVGRDVAIKRLRCEGAPPAEAVSRFLREARVQGRLDHPAIVPVHDLGTDEAGVPYFAMKRLAGTTLAAILERLAKGDADAEQRWPRRLLLARLAEICLAVQFAHTRGVVHRDLKPHNVMLGDYGEVYVLDWGIAKIADDDPAPGGTGTIRRGDLDTLDSVVGETAAGAVLGTPGYMPPEQVRGGAIDHRVDVYALGCMLFEVLALEPAHPRGAGVLEATLTSGRLRPAARRPDADIPPELDDATADATAPDARDRTPDARALHDAIQRYLDGDRDVARRKELAAAHAAAAEAADDRRDAMREAGRALALDPTNRAAQAVVGRILLEPPRETPPEVERALTADRLQAGRAHLRTGGIAYSVFLLYPLALALCADVHEWWLPIVTTLIGTANAALTFLMLRRTTIGNWMYVALALDCLTVGTVGMTFTPLVLVPTLTVVSTLMFLSQPLCWKPAATITSGLLSIAWPLAGEWLGLLPRTYAFVDGEMVIHPWAIGLPETGTTVMLLLVPLVVILAGASMVIHLRIAQEASEKRVHLLAWHLQQLVPERDDPASD